MKQPIYLQYHNCETQGALPHPISRAALRVEIHTRVNSARSATGRVLLIAGMGQPRRYFLWSSFVIEECRFVHSEYQLAGAGWQLAPPQLLDGPAFDSFKAACANFIGFRQITDLPLTSQLLEKADQYQPPGSVEHQLRAFHDILQLTKHNKLREQIHTQLATLQGNQQPDVTEPTIALSIRQPHAEAILRGIKKIEYRREATRRRGRILIYTSKLPADDASTWMKKYGITDVKIDDLPRGVIVGSVDLFDCDGGQWYLQHPQRARTLLVPRNRPQPIWFHPFDH